MEHRRIHTLLTAAAVTVSVVAAAQCLAKDFQKGNLKKAKNVIFMVPDGMGISNVTAARIFANGPDGSPLAFETLSQVGYQRTHSRNSTVTDSAAAAGAWACGEKFNNGEICLHDDNGDGISDGAVPTSLLEAAKALGKKTALVATSGITHATPAAFASHVHNRKCEFEIARQYVEVVQVDVLLGGGFETNRGSCLLPHYEDDGPEEQALIQAAQDIYGYAYVTDGVGLSASASEADKLLGLFTKDGKTPETFRVTGGTYPEGEPTLAEMTAAALDSLEESRRGFFMVVEGSQIDWEDHDNDIAGQIGETLAFDAAVEVVMHWVGEKHSRSNDTLVVVVPDHDTGGLAINGPYGSLSTTGEVIEDGWTTGDHTATDVVFWSQGPGSEILRGPLDNTDFYGAVLTAMRPYVDTETDD